MNKENNKSLNYFIFAVVVLIFLFGGWIIFGNNSNSGSSTPYTVYNGYVIYEVKDENLLRYKVEAVANNGVKYVHNFRNYPSDLLDLDYSEGIREKILHSDLTNSIKKDKIYFSYDPEMDGVEILAFGTLIQILGTGDSGVFRIPTVISVSKENNNPDFPLKTCDDATENIGVIELRYGDPKLYLEEECVVIQGRNREDFIKYNDLLSYILLEVI